VRLIYRTFFDGGAGKDDFGYLACTQDLTPLDALFHIDLSRLVRGEEKVEPRAIVTSRLKFVNEVQRANSLLYNGLLPLLSERQVAFRDRVFPSPEFVCFLDANPLDSGSSEMPQAFRDRIDFSLAMPVLPPDRLLALENRLLEGEEARFGDLATLARPVLTSTEMVGLWAAVRRVAVPAASRLFSALLAAHLQSCRVADRSRITSEFVLPCRDCPHRQDSCAKLVEIPGTRFIVSLLKLSQARAWLRGAAEVEIDDLLYGLPYVLAHRLKIRPESLRLYPGAADWIREDLYRRGLRHRVPRWRQTIGCLLSEDPEDDALLREFAARDQALGSLLRPREKERSGELDP
jgi:MoxR-like ATPase